MRAVYTYENKERYIEQEEPFISAFVLAQMICVRHNLRFISCGSDSMTVKKPWKSNHRRQEIFTIHWSLPR